MKKTVLLALFLIVSLFSGIPAEADNSNDLVQTADQSWATWRDVMPGERVLCRSAVSARKDGDVFCGVLTRGLTFERVIQVLRDGERVNAALYTVVTERQEQAAAFTLHISAAAAGAPLIVEYELFVNDAAERENRFTLVREGDSPSDGGALRLNRLTLFRGVQVPESGQVNPVAGSCLCLCRDKAGLDRIAFRQRGENMYLACAAEDCGHARHLFVMKTPRNGLITLEGVPQGTYYLRETRPADGEEASPEPREITVTEDGRIFCDGTEQLNGMASLLHRGKTSGVSHRFNLLEFYRRGIRVMTVILCVLVGSRRYSVCV